MYARGMMKRIQKRSQEEGPDLLLGWVSGMKGGRAPEKDEEVKEIAPAQNCSRT